MLQMAPLKRVLLLRLIAGFLLCFDSMMISVASFSAEAVMIWHHHHQPGYTTCRSCHRRPSSFCLRQQSRYARPRHIHQQGLNACPPSLPLSFWQKSSPLLLSSKTAFAGRDAIIKKTTTKKSLVALRGGAAAVLAAATSSSTPPALITWIVPALLCALSYALYNLFIKKASATIDPLVGGVLLQIVAAALGGIVLIVKRATTTTTTRATTAVATCTAGSSSLHRAAGLKWAVAAGLAVGLAELLSFIISGMGVQAMQSIPIIVGGSVLCGTVLGAVWLGEALTIKGWLGVLLIAAGIALVGMDG